MDSTRGLITCKASKHRIDPHCIIFKTDKRYSSEVPSPSWHLRGLYWMSGGVGLAFYPWLVWLNDPGPHTDRTAEPRAAPLTP